MANGNGNGKNGWTSKALAAIIVVAVGAATSLVVAQVSKNSSHTEDNETKITEVHRRVDSLGIAVRNHQKDAAVTALIQNYQLAEIAKKVGAPVIVDTTRAEAVMDSVRADTTR